MINGKKLFPSLALLSLLVTSAGLHAEAPISDGPTTLTATIPTIHALTCNDQLQYMDTLEQLGGMQDRDLLKMTLSSNDPDGFTVDVHFGNGGRFQHTADFHPDKRCSYIPLENIIVKEGINPTALGAPGLAAFLNQGVTLENGTFVLNSGNAEQATFEYEMILAAKLDVDQYQFGGNYQETVTVTLTANSL